MMWLVSRSITPGPQCKLTPVSLPWVIRIHVVLIAVEAPPVLLGPARILVFLPVFGWLLLPRLGRLAALDRLVLLARVPLFGHGHDGGINDLSSARDVSASKNPSCPIVRLRESCRQVADSHGSAGQAIFRGALEIAKGLWEESRAKTFATAAPALRQQAPMDPSHDVPLQDTSRVPHEPD